MSAVDHPTDPDPVCETDPPKTVPKAYDDWGRFREVISDPLNLLIERVPDAGAVVDGLVTLHNGVRVPINGPGAYYGEHSHLLVFNRGVFEPLEEFLFQQMLKRICERPVMLELGAYWAHYSLWLKRLRPEARTIMVEPDIQNLKAGRNNFKRYGLRGEFIQAFVDEGHFEVDAFMQDQGLEHLDVLHSDIQGYEIPMLAGASRLLERHAVDYVFISTHKQKRHWRVRNLLERHGYRVEVSSDCDSETTSYDGLVFATRPEIPPLVAPFEPFGRDRINRSTAFELVDYLAGIRARLEA
jgi:hypothetical protein